MASFNKVILIGNLTRDPELRTIPNGTSVCRFSLAVSRQSRNADGSSREEVVFIEVDAFAKQAEIIARHLTKGSPILVEGRLKLDQWESQTGEKRSKILVIAESFQFLSSQRRQDGGGMDYASSDGGNRRDARPRGHGGGGKRYSEDIVEDGVGGDEEIPF
ncbi:MAG: single-stranded DNA-binding protein [Puniceicoccales bacterium]|jgi:single-strand DNA-binding protein|nr:single-stranded DNA-binding protein [Puniceicoccales bacterium]